VSIFSFIHNSASGNCDSQVWLDSTNNENIVLGSARFYIEYKQMEHRVRLDVPTLADPQVRDLLQESDLFARSFSGGGFGFISPLDFINVFSLIVEILSHLWILVSFTRDASHFGILLLTIASALFPFILARFSNPTGYIDSPPTSKEAQAADKQERMRNLAYSDIHRPEIALFGLGDWILSSWSAARKVVLSSEAPITRNTTAHFADIMYALQNVSRSILASYETDWGLSAASFTASYFAVASIIRNHIRRRDGLSDLHTVHALRVWQLGDDCKDGVPGNLSHVRFLCEHQTQAQIDAQVRGGHPLQAIANRSED
jgi:hypothetical protein